MPLPFLAGAIALGSSTGVLGSLGGVASGVVGSVVGAVGGVIGSIFGGSGKGQLRMDDKIFGDKNNVGAVFGLHDPRVDPHAGFLFIGVGDCPWIADAGMPNDSVSYIYIQKGYELDIFEHANYGGIKHTFYGDRENEIQLGGNRVWNDQISSFKLRKTSSSAVSILQQNVQTMANTNPSNTGVVSYASGTNLNQVSSAITGTVINHPLPKELPIGVLSNQYLDSQNGGQVVYGPQLPTNKMADVSNTSTDSMFYIGLAFLGFCIYKLVNLWK